MYQCINQLKDYFLKTSKLELINFRGYRNVSVEFDANFNVKIA